MPYKDTSQNQEANARYREKGRNIPRKKCKDPRRRKRLEKDPPAWLRYYLSEAYPMPFGKPHTDIIERGLYAIKSGSRMAVAAPRGTGKSTVLNGLVLYCLVCGLIKFPVYIPWRSQDCKKAMRFWKNALCFNAKLAADYPELCAPFVGAKGNSQKLLTLNWSDTSANTGARLNISEGMIILPDSLGVIGSTTINGNPRGLFHSTESGEVVRPDVAFIDDPQDREAAGSRQQVLDIIEVIKGDVMGMGPPGKKISALMSCTVIERNDVADQVLKDPEWDSLRVPQIIVWPKNRTLWDAWNQIRLEGLENKDDGQAALNFYNAHKPEMIEAFVVSWAERFDAGRLQPDAFYGAMWDYYSMGESAFMAERQNDPMEEGIGELPYVLTPELICSRQADREPFRIPEWVSSVVFSTDLNPSYALTSALVGFGRDQTASVIWYGLFQSAPLPIKNDMPQQERGAKLYEALVLLGRQLAGMQCHGDIWAIDASGEYFDVVLRFAAQSVQLCGLQAQACTGAGAKNFRQYGKNVIGQPREQCNMRGDTLAGRRRKWFHWQADYWKEVAQKAWLGSVGAPGSLSIFRGNHHSFAEQICRETLAKKGTGLGGQTEWIYKTAPGPHDYGDVMAQAYAMAAWGGIGTIQIAQPRRYVEKRKCKVAREG